MSYIFKSATLSLVVAIVLLSQSTFAKQKPVEVEGLETIVVTATKSEQDIQTVPAQVSVINKQQLNQSAIQGLPQVLQTEAAANVVQSGGLGQITSIFLRGTNSNHALILRDGARLNSATTGAASLAFLDTSDLERIEILKGPSSVLYGSDAIGGVVQLISKKPETTGGFLTGIYGENDTYKAIVGANLVENGFYAQVRGQRLESDGTIVTNRPNTPTAEFDQKGYSAKLGYEQDQFAASVDYAQNEGFSRYDNYGSLASQNFDNELINIKGRVNLGEDVSLNARLSQFKDNIEQNDTNFSGTKDFVHSTSKEAELYATWNFLPQHTLLAGTTYSNIKGDVISWGSPYQGKIKSQGYFIQHQFNTDKINTQAGIRLEDNEKYGNHTVAQGAIRYHFTPVTSVYANIGSAFKAPTINQLYSSAGNLDLQPEESISYELGLDHKFTENLHAGLSAYRTEVDNLISWVNGKNINVNQATLTGGETYVKWKADDLFVNASYTYVQPKNDITKQDLQRRPRHSATLTVGLENEQYGLSTSVVAKSQAKEYDNNHPTPGYAVLNINGYWNVTPNIKLFTNIDNIGDVKYKTALNDVDWQTNVPYYYLNGGRQANVGVTFKY